MSKRHIEKIDTLNQGREKINDSIDAAFNAETKSWEAKEIANQSNQIAGDAKDIAINTDDRLDNMLSGELQDGEVADARKPFGGEAYPNLGKRLDDQIGKNSDFRAFESDKSFMEKTQREFAERQVNLDWYTPDKTGAVDVSDKIIDASNTGDKLLIRKGIYALSNPVDVVVDIEADYATLKAQTEGIPYLLSLKNRDTLVIKGLKFDLNLLGRGGLHISGVRKVVVKDCEFAGYTAEFGYYKTDSCLLITDCEEVIVENCYFHDTGYQYGESLETLNRCITIQGDNGKRALISNCRIARANQGIVASGANLDITIKNCDFDSTKDNSIYFIPVKNGKVFGCTFDDKHDESIVLTGGDFIIADNHFKNTPNKFIAITGDVKSLAIRSNRFESSSEFPTDGIVSFRKDTFKVGKLSISDCFIDIYRVGSTNDIFLFGLIDALQISNTIIRLVGGEISSTTRLFSFRGIIAPKVATFDNVDFIADGGILSNQAFFIEGNVDRNTKVSNSDYQCRSTNKVTTRDAILNPNIQNNIGITKNKVLFGSPQPAVGNWEKGDIIFNNAPAIGGSLNCAGWICTSSGSPGIWRKFGILE